MQKIERKSNVIKFEIECEIAGIRYGHWGQGDKSNAISKYLSVYSYYQFQLAKLFMGNAEIALYSETRQSRASSLLIASSQSQSAIS